MSQEVLGSETLDEIRAILDTTLHESRSPVLVLYAPLMDTSADYHHLIERCNDLVLKLGETLPKHQVKVLKLIEDLRLSDFYALCVLRSALAKAASETLWLHYEAAKCLDRLGRSGWTDTSSPKLMHAFMALQVAPADNPAIPLMRQFAGEALIAVAPREALWNSAEALRAGQVNALAAIEQSARQLNLWSSRPLQSAVSQIDKLLAACNLPRWNRFGITTKDGSSSVSIAGTKPSSTIPRTPPAGDSEYYQFIRAGVDLVAPEIKIYEIRGGVLSVDVTRLGLTQYYLFDNKLDLIEDLSCGVFPFIGDDVRSLSGSCGILSDRFSGPMNICHFYLDSLTRIPLYDQVDQQARLLFFDDHPYYRSAISGTSLENRVVWPSAKRFSIKADRLYYSSNVGGDWCHPAHYCSEWALSYLRSIFRINPLRQEGSRRIFVSRADAKSRQILNMPEVLAVLSRSGFDIVELAKLSIQQQRAVFEDACFVVGVHGAGLTNVVFSAPGTKVLEILPPLAATPAYWYLCNAFGHEYWSFIADDPEHRKPDYSVWSHQNILGNRNIHVDAERLADMISRAAAGRKFGSASIC